MSVAFGCGSSGSHAPDASPPALALDVVGSAQPGITFGQSQLLTVRLHTADASSRPVLGATVRFSIFRDPVGSTLSGDRAQTDANGLASVTVTGGQMPASFVVTATTTNAPEADFDVSVAEHANDFVELDVQLSWTGDAATTTLRALLYDQQRCRDLPAAATVPPPFRAFAVTASNMTTVAMEHLLPQDFAVVGRAEDSTSGRLVGYGCVDVPAGLLPAGSMWTLPLPLGAVIASPAGEYTLTSVLTPAKATVDAVLAPWRTLSCTNGVGQLLLDAMGVDQGAADAKGCKSAMIDQQVQTLLTSGAPGNKLAAIYQDFQAATASATVHSTLTVAAAGAARWAGEHQLFDATLPGQTTPTSLVDLGLPVIDVENVGVGYDGVTMTLGNHGFTLGWTTLWSEALDDAIATRAPTTPPKPALTVATLMPAVVADASGTSRCPQVSTIACKGAGGCDLTQACRDAVTAIGAAWQAPLAATTTLDLEWSGSASAFAGIKDLTVDQLVTGMWTSDQLASGSFSGMRSVITPP